MKSTIQPLEFFGIISALLAISLFVSPAIAEHATLDQMIENAKTMADHEAVAQHYENDAKKYQAKAEEHRKMATSYSIMSQDKAKLAAFVAHCNKLVTKYEELAKEDLELAKLHHQFAAQLAQ